MEQTGVGGSHQAKRSRNRNGRGIRLRELWQTLLKGGSCSAPWVSRSGSMTLCLISLSRGFIFFMRKCKYKLIVNGSDF